MAAAGAGGGVVAQEPLQLVDYDIPEVTPPFARFSKSIRRIKETGPWFRIRPETAKYGNVYYIIYSTTPETNKYVEKSAELPAQLAPDGRAQYTVQFREIDNALWTQWITPQYDQEGRFLGGNGLLIYAIKEEMPTHLIVGPRGRQYREALVRTFGSENAINISMANVRSNAIKRRASALSTRIRMGGRRRRSRRRSRRR